ncbi:hypothetical protein CDL12_02427 [Handroanthus impetiginosus]|uniref:Uncharacterized protein n=1 Tax=Handroanthus impetiginosus TaxID=429701 RepID=A0A2G9I523_9LAMI|nr:hypothetical protein CDL12_02427 [Handroanthus impetiginosus]
MDGKRRPPANIGEVSVFVPGLRIPKPVDLSLSLGDYLTKSLLERLSALRTRIIVMTGQEAPRIPKKRWKAATQHGGSTLGDLLQALEDFLPVLLGLVKDGKHVHANQSSNFLFDEHIMEHLRVCIEQVILCNTKYSLSGSIKRMKQRSSYVFTFSTINLTFLEFRG